MSALDKATTADHHTIRGSTIKGKLIIIGLSLVAVIVLAYFSTAAFLPPSIKISPSDGSREVDVDKKLKVSASWMRGEIKSVEVKETTLDPMGAALEERTVKGELKNGVFVADSGNLLKADARYEVTVNAELLELSLTGPSRKEVRESHHFQTVTTPVPLFSETPQLVQIDEPIVVEFNTPVKEFSYEIKPHKESSSRIDDENPARAYITYEGYQQGEQFDLTITSVKAKNGEGLAQQATQKIAATEPLIVTFIPGDGEAGASLQIRPRLIFNDNISNPDKVDSLLAIEPAVLGGWEWTSDDTIEFVPLHDWVKGSEVTISLKGGVEGLRGASGSFLRQDVTSTFITKPSKLIDVNLATQTVTLYDNDEQVRTMISSSGAKATPSLTGTYAIYAKADILDMRGEGYEAEDVPWVLMFNGDYTIHGNYWATTFGVPSSHGCIGLPVSDAEFLYNWSPIGTIVSIHY